MSGAPDSNAPATGSDATHQSIPSNEPNFDASFEDIFRFDPFAAKDKAGDENGATGTASTEGTPQPSDGTVPPVTPPVAPTGQQATQPQTPAPQTPPAQTPAQMDPVTAANLAAAQALTAAAQNFRQPPAQPQTPADDPSLNYNFELPQPLVAALTHEDPNVRMRATSAMNAALAREVHTRMRAEMTRYAETTLPQMMQSMLRAHTFRETIKNDFYGKYPMLNNPHLAPMVASITTEVLNSAGPNVSWSDQIRDSIAEKIFTMVPGLRVPAGQQPRPAAPPPAQPPRQFTNGTRPPAGPGGMEADVLSTLGFN